MQQTKNNTLSHVLNNIVRKNVAKLIPYESARSLFQGEKILMDANESAVFDPSGILGDDSCTVFERINRYPSPRPKELLQIFSKLYGVQEDMIITDRGVDGIIDMVIRAFCEPGKDSILICPPTYGVYEIFGNTHGINVKKAPLSDTFDLDLPKIRAEFDSNVKLVFICTPNNPTGNLVPMDHIRQVLDVVQGRAIVAIDEAYMEFAGAKSAIDLITENPNIIVMRTLSKAYGLAGLRVGSALAHPEIIKALLKVQAPYPINVPTINFLKIFFSESNMEKIQNGIDVTNNEKFALMNELSKMKFVLNVYPSDTNFFIMKCVDSKSVMDHCSQNGFVLRDRSKEPGLSNCIRISIGAPEQNRKLVETLKQYDCGCCHGKC